MIDEYVTPAEAARLLGVHPQSLRRWEKEEKILAYRTPGNQRRFLKSEIARLAGQEQAIRTVCYARVSTSSQRDDLERQLEFLRSKYPSAEFICEIGSGLNFKRKRFIAILERVISRDIQCLVVAHSDRLVRFGFELVGWLCEKHGVELVVLNDRKLSPEQELVWDMLSIIHCFSSRLYGLRKYRKQIGQKIREKPVQEEEAARCGGSPRCSDCRPERITEQGRENSGLSL